MKTTGMIDGIIVALFVSLSLFVLLMLSKKNKFYPAMPFLTIGCAVGYLATLLI